MYKALLAIIYVSLLIASSFNSVIAQTPENLTLPEYYGIYGLIDGKLCGITVPTQGCSVKTVDIKIGNESVKAIEYKKGTQFLIYQENPSSFAASLSLRPMLFIRNFTLVPFMQSQGKTEIAGFWRLINVGTDLAANVDGSLREAVQPIQFLVKPFKASSVLAVAAKDLTPGLYHFSGKDLTASGQLYFWVGSSADAEVLKCADLVRNSFMAVNLADNYKSCSEEMKSATAVIGSPGGDASVSTTSAELIEISKKLDDAQIRGDKATIESYLTDDFVFRDVGNRKTMDRAKFLSKIKPDKSIKSYNCYDYKLSFESDQAVLSGLCEYDIRQILALHVKERFTDRFVKRDGNWKLAVAEFIILPNR